MFLSLNSFLFCSPACHQAGTILHTSGIQSERMHYNNQYSFPIKYIVQ